MKRQEKSPLCRTGEMPSDNLLKTPGTFFICGMTVDLHMKFIREIEEQFTTAGFSCGVAGSQVIPGGMPKKSIK